MSSSIIIKNIKYNKNEFRRQNSMILATYFNYCLKNNYDYEHGIFSE